MMKWFINNFYWLTFQGASWFEYILSFQISSSFGIKPLTMQVYSFNDSFIYEEK